MTKHVSTDQGLVVQEYILDTLGAPFEVVLVDSVKVSIDPKSGEEIVEIPDMVGLIGAVVRNRVTHANKLSGREIKFIRNALGVQAKSVAKFLDMSPEHYSRCEGGTKVLSANSEKTLRLFAFMGTMFKDPETLFAVKIKDAEAKKSVNLEKAIAEFVGMFFSMRIKPVFTQDKLSFSFVRNVNPEAQTSGDSAMEYALQDRPRAA